MAKKVITIDCPNPCCDESAGCCLCDFSGKIEVYKDEEYEFTEETKIVIIAEYNKNLKDNEDNYGSIRRL